MLDCERITCIAELVSDCEGIACMGELVSDCGQKGVGVELSATLCTYKHCLSAGNL